mgnify:CR=1 FL=1
MIRALRTLTLVAVMVAFTLPALAQGRGGRPAHPAEKRIPYKLLKQAEKKLDEVEQRLEGRNKLGDKELAVLKLEVKEARLSIREFLMEMNNRKEHLPSYECCPCNDKGVAGGKLEINVNVNGGSEPVADPVLDEVPQEVVEPLTGQSYDALLAALKEQGFADDKLSVLQTAARNAWFTADQVKGMLKMFSFPDDKLSALRIVSNLIVDPENKFLLYGSFVHSSDKEEAKKILEGN